jgi:hypothetical protein
MHISKQIFSRYIKPVFVMLALTAGCYTLFSFTTAKIAGDVLSSLGITSSQANERITSTIMGGYINTYGIKNLKSIASGNRTAVAQDLLVYTKTYVNSPDFTREYMAAKQAHKPDAGTAPEAPEVFKNKLVEQAKLSLDNAQKYYNEASAETKALFKEALEDAKKYAADMQDPENDLLKSYADGYSMMLDNYKKDSAARIAQWQAEYPDNSILFVKKRLEEFMKVTADIDFNAELVEKNGKKYFVNQQYERKDYRWKMAFRAGSDVIKPSRDFVQQWLNEIK